MLKAIETSYKGYRFRSRLEARWAVFFDALKFVWKYELQGFDLGDLGWYLPDFLVVPEGIGPAWVEVKPFLLMDNGLGPDAEKTLNRFTRLCYAQLTDSPYEHYCGLLLGGVPGEKTMTGFLAAPAFSEEDAAPMVGQVMLCGFSFAECPRCRRICCLALGTHQSGHEVVCTCLQTKDLKRKARLYIKDKHLDKYIRSDRLRAAYTAARSARFEHGERP